MDHFDLSETIHRLKHYLPAQAALKDFIHHNTLHAFQDQNFFEGVQQASRIFGYKTTLSLTEFRDLFAQNRIREDILKRVIEKRYPQEVDVWMKNLLTASFESNELPRVGRLRAQWKRVYRIDLDSMVHPILFRLICSYLDQGISLWNFPVWNRGLLESIREMERLSFSSFFKTKRARQWLIKGQTDVKFLLERVVGDPLFFEQYLFDQQFAHPGWSGLVATIEDQPQTLLDQRSVSLHDLIVLELLLEIDALDDQFEEQWNPLTTRLEDRPLAILAPVGSTALDRTLALWQEAFEWTYYDQVLEGLKEATRPEEKIVSFQALFCIDDRECSFRRYLERMDASCATFGTPGFFGVEFFFQPQQGKFYTKLCPAPITPGFLIKEKGGKSKREVDFHLSKHTHSLVRGWLISQTMGFWSAIKLFLTIFRPSLSPATATSFRHMDKDARLTVENTDANDRENNLQIGFTIPEMATRVEGLLKSIGLISDFAPLVYVVGHGSSSVNNPHFSAYDCGACSGRAGSVNARVLCQMANQQEVRKLLSERGILISDSTRFVGGLHDTTRDDITFFDEHLLSEEQQIRHKINRQTFTQALDLNAKERSRRFTSIDTRKTPEQIHKRVRVRSVSLFEPRPELNHATNALCIVGRREMTQGLFLDRRSFLNSFDYRVDPDGTYLLNILKAAAPVCGGINLEYFFSRVDNQKLGAGTKLPHNVMGLFGVANGIDGDLRPGLPSQMIEVHDPIRLMIIVEHFPEVVLDTIKKDEATYEWFSGEWVHLTMIHPETRKCYCFENGKFTEYIPLVKEIDTIADIDTLLESAQENFPVYKIMPR
jgi:uncharacterized protein YbcC (UPF0753/DUF2309 family)